MMFNLFIKFRFMEDNYFDYEDLFEWLTFNDYLMPNKIKSILYEHVPEFIEFRSIMTKVDDALKKGIMKLILEQYPVMKKEGDEIAEINARFCWANSYLSMDFFVKKIIEDGPFDKKTKNLINDISKNNRKANILSKPKLLKVSEQPNDSKLTKAQWKKKCKIHNLNALQKYRFHKKRMDEFLKAIHDIFIKHFPEIKNFSTDQKKDYDSFLQERYRAYRFSCEQLQLVLDYELDGSFIHKSKTELAKIISKLNFEKRAEVKDINKRRLLGEKI